MSPNVTHLYHLLYDLYVIALLNYIKPFWLDMLSPHHPPLVSQDAELVDIRRMLHQKVHASGRRADAQQGMAQAVGRIGIWTSSTISFLG
jgi:hypothetical protein